MKRDNSITCNYVKRVQEAFNTILIPPAGPAKPGVKPPPAPSPGLISVRTNLATLKSETDLLQSAWSEMATRNLHRDLMRPVKNLQAVNLFDTNIVKSGISTSERSAVTSNLKDLMKRIETVLKQHSPTAARYDYAACFGYKVKVAHSTFRGKPDDRLDMQKKCTAMVRAIRSAYGLADQGGRNLNANNKVLKVFVAPEFYFRGINGAYSHDVVHGDPVRSNPGIVEMMLKELKQPIYKDWLFVLGTAICSSREEWTQCTQSGCGAMATFVKDPNTGTTTPKCKVNPAHPVATLSSGAHIENVGFIIKEGEVHTVTKELVSGVDFDTHTGKGIKDVVNVKVDGVARPMNVERNPQASNYDAANYYRSKFTDERMGGCIFTIDGLTIGVEVCLDHAATTSSGAVGRLEHAANIQIQLIPSAGMSIGSLRTVPGGIVFNVDGSTPHVQAVAGTAPTVFLGKDFRFVGASWNDLENVGADVTKLTAMKTPTKRWDNSQIAPVANAGNGSIVLFGPFDIPQV